MALMAADAGMLARGRAHPVRGRHRVWRRYRRYLSPVNSDNFFELQFLEINLFTSPGHPCFPGDRSYSRLAGQVHRIHI
jgi:hypothetical protein